ncbi:hypothetical protein C2845_PM02G23210 [Panicum miliaceum]|uniref:Uncharacterized protein n=1 Tax=Panicum miliaceum TaxID=4540 RepID=A0A3L6SA24_PANMI|nr:hypothetical protein C2845_PM02G23210 [Panicum miliaceum]
MPNLDGRMYEPASQAAAVEPIRMLAVEEIKGHDIWSNCVVCSVVSGVRVSHTTLEPGGGLGVLMGLFFGALDNPIMVEGMTARQQIVYTAKQMRRSISNAKTFAVMGLIFSAAECVVEKARAKHDTTNTAVAGCHRRSFSSKRHYDYSYSLTAFLVSTRNLPWILDGSGEVIRCYLAPFPLTLGEGAGIGRTAPQLKAREAGGLDKTRLVYCPPAATRRRSAPHSESEGKQRKKGDQDRTSLWTVSAHLVLELHHHSGAAGKSHSLFVREFAPGERCYVAPCRGRRIAPIRPPRQGDLRVGKQTAAARGLERRRWGALVLSTADPLAKARLTHAAFSRWAAGLPVGQAAASDHPTRPDKPLVVTQKEIITHNDMGMPLNAYMLHNLAHVELNAIDLAWDLRSGKGRGMASSRISLARPMTRAATFGGTRSGLLSLGSG